MFPNLFSIGLLEVHTYGLFVAAGFVAGILFTMRLAKSQDIQPQKVIDMALIMVLAAIAGSRLMYVGINISYFRGNFSEIFKIWEGGLVFSGGLIAVMITMVWYLKRVKLAFWTVGDLWAPAIALGQGIGRIGCFMAGCCYGKPTDLPWAVTFTHPDSLAPKGISLHPTQIYQSISGFAIFAILYSLYKNKKFEGQVFLWLLILHSVARLLIERFRGDDRGILFAGDMTFTQLTAVLILIGSIITLNVFKLKRGKYKEEG